MQSLVEIGPMILEEKISSMYFGYIRYYLPLENGMALHLNKLVSDALC